MPTYASTTTVSVEKSQAEIRRIFARYKATGFMFAERGDNVLCAFECRGRNIVLPVPMPTRHALKQVSHPSGNRYQIEAAQRRAEASHDEAYQQEVRQRWRVMVLLLKAKLEAIELGVSSFDDEFLSYTMLPSGRTVGQELGGQVEHMMLTGQVPNLMPALTDGRHP